MRVWLDGDKDRDKKDSPIEEDKMSVYKARLALQGWAFHHVVMTVSFLVVGLTLLIAALVVQTRSASSAGLSSNAVVVDRSFPGKEKDDLTTVWVPAEKVFPGKEIDDLVSVRVAWERRFPGKEMDDLNTGVAADKHFPGKEPDDTATSRVAGEMVFPGKEMDDLAIIGAKPDRRFPGKEQDDLVIYP